MAQRDAQLLERWRAGNADAGNRLLARYRDRLLRFFDLRVSTEAEDLTQRTLLLCAEGRASIREADSFRAYAFGVARNVLLQHLRQRASSVVDDFSDVAVSDAGPSPSRVVAHREEQRLLLRGLQTLPLEAQMLLELHYWEGMRTVEIGRTMGCPKSTVTTKLHRARAQLREAVARLPSDHKARSTLLADMEGWSRSLRDLRMPTAG